MNFLTLFVTTLVLSFTSQTAVSGEESFKRLGITFPDYYDAAGPNCRALAQMAADIAVGGKVEVNKSAFTRDLNTLLSDKDACTETVVMLNRAEALDLGKRYPASLRFIGDLFAASGKEVDWKEVGPLPLRVSMKGKVAQSIEVDIGAVAALRQRLPR
ncbi:MAG: hypothetical protein AAF680_03085 [Pseudomonadota bacterium]